MTPCFPANLYPVQSCNQYGSSPHTLLIFQSKGNSSQNTSMLWLLCGILTRIQELWTLVNNIQLYQSQWNGWLLTYISNKMFPHYTRKHTKGDPFMMQDIRSVNQIIEKMVNTTFN